MKKLILRIIIMLLFYDLEIIADEYNNTLAVLDVKLANNVPEIIEGLITDYVFDSVYQYAQKDYTVIARSLRESMMDEIEFSISDISDNISSALRIGNYLSARYVILTSVQAVDSKYSIMMQMVNVTTTEIEGSYLSEAIGIRNIKEAIEICVSNILNENTVSNYDFEDTNNQEVSVIDTTGNIMITTHPEGAAIYIGGILSGTSPLLLENLEPGNISIEIKCDGYDNNILNERIITGVTVNLEKILVPRPEPLFEMVYVTGGTFNMGSIDGDYEEEPVHTVRLNSFLIGKYEITYSQYMEFVEDTGRDYYARSKWCDDDKPVINVSWYDAIEFCNWLSLKELYTPCYSIRGDWVYLNSDADGYRLPTEAEWEYAASGGISDLGALYSGSNNADSVSWNKDNTHRETHETGEKVPNRLGIYDMSGNVWEWCWDWYDEDYYIDSSEVSPPGPVTGYYKIVRGGSWDSDDFYLRCTARGFCSPVSYDTDIGFRVVRNIE